MLPIHGRVVLVGQSRTSQGPSRHPWDEAVTPVREAFLGPDKDSLHATLRNRKPGHVEILTDSAFNDMHRRLFTVNRSVDLETAIGQQLTYSYSTAELLGDRVEEFLQAARAAIIEACGPGPYTSREATEVIIARRPATPGTPPGPLRPLDAPKNLCELGTLVVGQGTHRWHLLLRLPAPARH